MTLGQVDAAPIETDIAVLSDLWEALPEAETVARRAVAAVAARADIRVPPDAELSLALADDAMVRNLNRDYRAKDKPTNVLSFPAPHGPLLGDVIIAWETLLREAEEEGITPADHLAHLTIHGLLHLLGYDDTKCPAKKIMRAKEKELLAII